MAEVQPIPALRYEPDVVGPLGSVTAPPYDVIDADQRRALLARSPYNVVAIDLPVADEGDPYEQAAAMLAGWREERALVDEAEPAFWALSQDYSGPDGKAMTRHGIFARVRVTDYGAGTIRPHERTQPGPKEDRLRLTRATKHNLSPIFSLYGAADAWPLLGAAVEAPPWAEVSDDDGTTHRLWRVSDPETIAAVKSALAPAELLIADGHHRYETARTYAEEIGGEGGHRYTLMCLTSLEDPGLTVFPTHRLLSNLEEPARQEALGSGLKRLFEIEEVETGRLQPEEADDVGAFGYIDSHFRRAFRLRLRDPAILDEVMGDRSPAYRQLDAAILEKLVLEGILGMSEADVEAKRGIGYAKSVDDVLAALDGGYQAAFILRPTPVEQVRAVADAGETMPPKSTYFFPKLLSGMVFNPLA
ncbi:MAG: hypothetical protein QOG09_1442 [Solirubrobacterales bacterium]|nr:hypothetical protein [Solirubrobacterales bacterium]MDX6663340.1 hypothetical protein [Solirubrobacterales bacterium]